MDDDEPWICQCRRCHGVHDAGDAVQYVWEWAFGACAVPVVVGVLVDGHGHVPMAWTYWHDEPDVRFGVDLTDTEYLVSCRPGAGTFPTEGDVARWMGWLAAGCAPCDWLLVDELRFRSVAACVQALAAREAMPPEQTIAGEWAGPPEDDSWRDEIRRDWPEIRARNRASWRM
jgi:hypothetical protein